jgi:hypothetical protein
MPKSKTSAVWKHFKKERDGSAVCKFCNKKLKTSGNTSNLMGHLSRLHKNNLSIPQENVCSNEDQNNENDENSNSEGNDAIIVNNPGNASTASSHNSNISVASTVTGQV